MECKICGSPSTVVFQALVLRKYNVTYFKCVSCGFIQTEDPYWLKEAYEHSINISDTGIVMRNRRSTRIATALIFLFFDRKAKFLDHAGGYGLFTRMMRDVGFDFYWSDPFTPNTMARGFEAEPGGHYQLSTSFESFEHFNDPVAETKRLLENSDNILASTELIPLPVPGRQWWYYGFEHGQHIALYTRESFQALASKLNLHYYNLDNFHLLTRRRLPGWGRFLLGLPRSKYVLYLLSFPIGLMLSSRTEEDMMKLKQAGSTTSQT